MTKSPYGMRPAFPREIKTAAVLEDLFQKQNLGMRKLFTNALYLLVVFLSCVETNAAAQATPARETRAISGWSVHVSRDLFNNDAAATDIALKLLAAQLENITRMVPPAALAELRKVPLWVSPEYPGIKPRAEYHPGAGWLRNNGRDPAMEKGVEFTNIRIFEAETRRMPVFVLHELAHAYHDRVLGTNNPEIKAAYESAKAGGKYDRVEQRFGDGRTTQTRAYAMTNPQEYFAESTEAFFYRNDFFPFTREELRRTDPRMFDLLERLWRGPQK